jgi:hypothetical protein
MEVSNTTTSKELKGLDVRLKVVDNLLRVFSSKIQNKLNNKEREQKRDLYLTTRLPSVERFNKTDKGSLSRPMSKLTTSADNRLTFYTTGALSFKPK